MKRRWRVDCRAVQADPARAGMACGQACVIGRIEQRPRQAIDQGSGSLSRVTHQARVATVSTAGWPG